MTSLNQFPFNRVKKTDKVILYGAGKNGVAFFKKISDEGLCEVIDVIDRNFSNILGFPVAVNSPESLRGREDYAFIIITINTKHIAESAYEDLTALGVQKEKIILAYEYWGYIPEFTVVETHSSNRSDYLKIVLHPTGSIGDFVITLKVYEELVKMLPTCIIDVFGDCKWFTDKVYFDLPNLGRIIEVFPDGSAWDEYDMVITVRFVPFLKKVNFNRVEELAPEFSERLREFKRVNDEEYVDLHIFQYENRIFFDRSKFIGLNRYTLLGYGGLIDVRDKKVNLPVARWAEERFKELNLPKRYMTFNYGAANTLHDNKPQTKQWPPEYHRELNRILKRAYPDLCIVQLGGKDVTIIEGADRYIIGEDLEVAKYVLKNSLFHFDCEGGLVHIATQLGTKCFVVFGPTPIWFMGYEQNVNIAPKVCGECKGLITDWYTRCYRGYSTPACMASIKPEEVLTLMSDFIDSTQGSLRNV